ncbi:MAG: SAF domain-containing protein [Endomicrobium sp.]|jgi:hypothetical protein|nr:SAF domain-containing protein [Endomicrobium sp.]
MKRWLVIVLIVVVALVSNGVQFFIQNRIYVRATDRLASEIATLQSTLQAIGPIVECYTPIATTFAGQEITGTSITKQSIPESFINDSFVLDSSALIGKYFKVALVPGTPITSDTVMIDVIDDTTREVDITTNRWPVGLVVGDYIDIRITYPYGEDFIVVPHLRVMAQAENSLKVYMNETQYHRYLAALVDFYLTTEYGTDVYVSKYIEPGLQIAATPYYAIPANIEAMIIADPNILDKSGAVIAKDLRADIERYIESVVVEEGGDLASGRNDLNSTIKGDFTRDRSDREQREEDGFVEEALEDDAYDVVEEGVLD